MLTSYYGIPEVRGYVNAGIGMVVIVAEASAGAAMQLLAAAGEQVYHIGLIETRSEGQAQTIVR